MFKLVYIETREWNGRYIYHMGEIWFDAGYCLIFNLIERMSKKKTERESEQRRETDKI